MVRLPGEWIAFPASPSARRGIRLQSASESIAALGWGLRMSEPRARARHGGHRKLPGSWRPGMLLQPPATMPRRPLPTAGRRRQVDYEAAIPFPCALRASRIRCPAAPRAADTRFNACKPLHLCRSEQFELLILTTRSAGQKPAQWAGGTQTHGRRIMNPLGILAALVDQRRFTPFLQVRRVDQRHPCAALVGLFLSVWPLNGPWGSMSWTLTTAAAASAQVSHRDGPVAQRSPLPEELATAFLARGGAAQRFRR